MPDEEIHIEELELSVRVGCPAQEQAQSQRLTDSITLQPRNQFRDLGDELERTVDYAAIARNCSVWLQAAIGVNRDPSRREDAASSDKIPAASDSA